ncbi:uncharacterized protein LOC131665237 [Phymastichus coffea]|uniref:uncharacterized protein LOC131665237 n=1 Tax=Phymastichus coffea TaxID=108790 RepID=UPI00273BD66C|nr:uncharacterized protein LOC131665237 [Phymastichus coffea]
MSGKSIFDSFSSDVENPLKITYSKVSHIFHDLITYDEVKNLVKRAVSLDAKLVNYHLRHYSEEKIGFLGSHLCLVVNYRRCGHHENEMRSFFLKTLPFDVPSQAAYIQEAGYFQKETECFRLLIPLMINNYKGKSWAPKCYIIKDYVLVFEDLKINGFSNQSRIFNEKTVKAALACIARFHASSLLTEEHTQGKSLKDLFPTLLKESQFKRIGLSYTWYSVAINLAVAIADELGLDSSNIRQASERIFDIGEPSQTKRNVVSHGDLWSNNMVFDDNGRCNLVDFQLIRYSPLAHDVMQLLYLCTSKEFRRKNERRMIEYYYGILTDTLRLNNFKGNMISLEEVVQGAEEQRFAALVTAVIFHPTVLMDGKTAGNIMNDTAAYESYYFKNRKPFVDEIMANNDDYRDRLIEDVNELVELSLKVDNLPRPT